jgi:hypothetical protein
VGLIPGQLCYKKGGSIPPEALTFKKILPNYSLIYRSIQAQH